MDQQRIITEISLPGFQLFSRGKVRDSYILPDGKLLIVVTDRISAFDVIVGAIPVKGKTLNAMSEFWLRRLNWAKPNHLIGTELSLLKKYGIGAELIWKNDLLGRFMVVEKAQWVIPFECIVRGYLDGSALTEYQKKGTACGIPLPKGLRQGDRLPYPLFTPSTKAGAGFHDENISYERMVELLGEWLKTKRGISDTTEALAAYLKSWSLRIYEEGAKYALERGIIIADTKFEFGIWDGQIILIDEILTPDSSRFWPLEDWLPGGPQQSFDKQFLRDYLTLGVQWDKKPPAPKLPADVIRITAEKYQEALRRLCS